MNSKAIEVSNKLNEISKSFSSLMSSIVLLRKNKSPQTPQAVEDNKEIASFNDKYDNDFIHHDKNKLSDAISTGISNYTENLNSVIGSKLNLSEKSYDLLAVDEGAGIVLHDNLTEPNEISSDLSLSPDNSLGDEWDFLLSADFSTPIIPTEASEEVLDKGSDRVIDNIIVDDLPLILEETSELMPEIEELLEQLDSGSKKVIEELHRKVHTIKGTVGQVGAMRARASFHEMENVMEELVAGRYDPMSKKIELMQSFAQAKVLVRELETGEWIHSSGSKASSPNEIAQPVQAPKSVKVNTEVIDKMISDLNEGRLSGIAIEDSIATVQLKIKDLEENGQRVSKMLRDIELQAEMQIQSHKTQIQDNGLDFDPLEFDRFTVLQELSRLVGEGVTDMLEVRRELTRMLIEQEGVVAQIKRTVQTSLEKLHKTRLTPVDAINDTLYGVVWSSAREMQKEISFELIGGRVELDRVLLEKIITPLKHIIRNSVAHGIEMPDERVKQGKSRKGLIRIAVRQEAGKAILNVSDDGGGLNVERVKLKAIDQGLWKKDEPMSDKQAAEMICIPSFSTATEVSQIAGRGVGMDVVRSEILALGGRFEITSKYGQGLFISIQLPTTVASASVLVVEAGSEGWAFPIEMVEHVILLDQDQLREMRLTGLFSDRDNKFPEWQGALFRSLEDLTDLHSILKIKQENAPILLLKERGRFMAIEVAKLVHVHEVPLRPAGTIWSHIKGVAGTVILPNGDAIFLVDPFGFELNKIKNKNQGSNTNQDGVIEDIKSSALRKNNPLIMVVDDSLTVRKATTRFLEKNGYDSICAKDGQEALELLISVKPNLILMDIEMPKMDGFDCTRNIRESSKHKDVPIIMITSRTAEKHRQHALELGVNEYLGKPFKDNELSQMLEKYVTKK